MIDLNKIPKSPGCYIYINKSGKIIYVGKAKNLFKRVKSYFTKKLDIKTSNLVDNIHTIDYFLTNNEIEALILENNLIKKHSPKYNIKLKDSKQYTYIKLIGKDFPRLTILRDKPKKDDVVFGPFVSASNRDYLIKFLNKNFKLRTCKKLPKTPCVRYHIGHCSAPCINKISKKEYLEKIENIKKILENKNKDVKINLEQKMLNESENNNFEKAIEYREQIKALDYLLKKQNVENIKNYNQDLINYIVKDQKVYLMVFNISKGLLLNKEKFVFEDIFQRDILDEFLVKYYFNKKIPKEIILPKKIEETTIDFLKKLKKSKLEITIPKKGTKKNLLDLAIKNIDLIFFKNINLLKNLKNKLKLREYPKVIECFDISHLSGTNTVASMVQFRDGIENKKEYRRFKIKNNQNDDVKSMSEVVNRRYLRLLKENRDFPNLIIIDGGKAQLNAAKKEIDNLNLFKKIDMIGIAKRDEEIYFIDRVLPLKLSKKNEVLKLIQRIRDEAHRFAITYQKSLRKKEFK